MVGLVGEIFFLRSKTKKQEKTVFWILVPIYILIGCLTATSIVEIFPVVATITYCYTLTMAAKHVVVGGLIDSVYWLFYDLLCGSYTGLLEDITIIVSNTFSLIHKNSEESKPKKA